MEEILRNVVTAVCHADPHLGAEWHDLLGRSAPSADDAQWVELVERITQVADRVGVPADGLMAALVDEPRPAELQGAIAAVVGAADSEPVAEAEVEAVAPSEQGAADVADGTAQEDPAAWNTYLRTNGARWDGNDESWPAFVEWFLYYANEQGVGTSARAFCDYATANGPRQVLTQYGVPVATPASPAGAGEPAEAAKPQMTVDQAVTEFGPEVFAEFRKQYPALAGIGDEELKVMMAELLSDQVA